MKLPVEVIPGTGVHFVKESWIAEDTKLNENIHIRHSTHIGKGVQIGSGVKIGRYVGIGSDVRIGKGSEIKTGTFIAARVQIGSNVKIAQGTQFKEGMQIQDNAVVTKTQITGVYPSIPIPIVENIDAQIVRRISEKSITLEMGIWHASYCKTTHCRAGSAIDLAGKAGYALEAECGPWLAGALIYQASRPGQPIPDFYADNDSAMEDLLKCATAKSTR